MFQFENIMFTSADPLATVKVIDFGLSGRFNPQDKMAPLTAQLGTFDTMAPEVFAGKYTTQADLWSAGVVAFEMLVGVKPFAASTPMGVVARISKYDSQLEPRLWERISKAGMTFVRALLEKKPEKKTNSS